MKGYPARNIIRGSGPGLIGMVGGNRRDMAGPSTHSIVEALLEHHGTTFASEAGIALEKNAPAPLFRLLCLSLLISARIRSDVAVAASRALAERGWTTPEAMTGASWEQRTRVLNQAGYARYDESTSRYLADSSTYLLERYDGDLRQLREEAERDRDVEHELLTRFKGIGDVGANVFLREVQVVWDEVDPFADERVLDSAEGLDLPTDVGTLRDLVSDSASFGRLVAALIRVRTEDAYSEVLEAAAQR